MATETATRPSVSGGYASAVARRRPADSRPGSRIWCKRERRRATGASQNIGHSPLR